MSSRLPIGVATTYSTPELRTSAIAPSLMQPRDRTIDWDRSAAFPNAKKQVWTAPSLSGDPRFVDPCSSLTLKWIKGIFVPLYEYQCKKCQHRFEKIQKFSDAPVKKCPECGGPVQQLLSPPAVQFKGSGWYVTDYARKGASSDSSSSTTSKDGGNKPAEKSEAKTESKAESKKTESKSKK